MENAFLKKRGDYLCFIFTSVHPEPKGSEPAAGANVGKKTAHGQHPKKSVKKKNHRSESKAIYNPGDHLHLNANRKTKPRTQANFANFGP